jgi:hypothetical protein
MPAYPEAGVALVLAGRENGAADLHSAFLPTTSNSQGVMLVLESLPTRSMMQRCVV